MVNLTTIKIYDDTKSRFDSEKRKRGTTRQVLIAAMTEVWVRSSERTKRQGTTAAIRRLSKAGYL